MSSHSIMRLGIANRTLHYSDTVSPSVLQKCDTFQVGIIGGSGFYNLEELKVDEEVAVETEFGDPSDKFAVGKIGAVDCVVLAR